MTFAFEDEDMLTEPCMSHVKKKSKRVMSAVEQLKHARTRMKVFVTDIIIMHM